MKESQIFPFKFHLCFIDQKKGLKYHITYKFIYHKSINSSIR